MRKLYISLFLGISQTLLAWSINPVIKNLSCEKPQSTFEIIADKEESPVAIECSIADREIAIDGTETETKNSKDFIIYPSHCILQPGQRRVIRIVWKGKSDIKEEKAYRFIAENLPVDFTKHVDEEEGRVHACISMAFRSLASVYIVPKKVFHKMQCTFLKIEEKEGHKMMALEFSNLGNQHMLLINHAVEVRSASGKCLTFSKKEVAEMCQVQYNILPNHKRVILFPLKDPFPQNEKVTVSLINE